MIMKKRFIFFICVLFTALVGLGAWDFFHKEEIPAINNGTAIGVIGGSDGPTAIFITGGRPAVSGRTGLMLLLFIALGGLIFSLFLFIKDRSSNPGE